MRPDHQPQSGARIKPTAQAVGGTNKMTKPRRGDRAVVEDLGRDRQAEPTARPAARSLSFRRASEARQEESAVLGAKVTPKGKG